MFGVRTFGAAWVCLFFTPYRIKQQHSCALWRASTHHLYPRAHKHTLHHFEMERARATSLFMVRRFGLAWCGAFCVRMLATVCLEELALPMPAQERPPVWAPRSLIGAEPGVRCMPLRDRHNATHGKRTGELRFRSGGGDGEHYFNRLV